MPNARQYALDNLRAVVVLLVVVLHGSMSYMAYAPPWWYVLDPGRSLLFTALVLLIDVPIMLIMFFLAGYFAYPSLARRGARGFVVDKLLRIGLPWVFGVLVLAPPTAYLAYYSRQSPISLTTFWRTDFWGPAFQQSVYWYLGVLLALFAATALLHATNRRFADWRPTRVDPGRWLLALFVVAMSVASLAVSLGFGYTLDSWLTSYLLVVQPVRVPLYIGYFALGIYAGQRGWFAEHGYAPDGMRWTLVCLLAGGTYLAFRLGVAASLPPLLAASLTILLFNVFCCSSLIAGVALFSAHGASAFGFWRSQARNSYGIYYLHPLILYPLALAFVALPLSIYVKAPAVILLGYLGSWAASAAILTRLPGLRRIF